MRALLFLSSRFVIASILRQKRFSTSLLSLNTPKVVDSRSIAKILSPFLANVPAQGDVVTLICSAIKSPSADIRLSLHDYLFSDLNPAHTSQILVRLQSEPHKALDFFRHAESKLGSAHSTQNYCILIHILAWSKHYDLVMELLSEVINASSKGVDIFSQLVVHADGCNYDLVVFDMLVKAYVKCGKVSEGLIAYRRMIDDRVLRPHLTTYNCLLNGLLKAKKIDLGWVLYQEMEKLGVSPNSFTFNILTNAFCKLGDVVKLKVFVEKIEEQGFEPDVVTYNTLINCYCRFGKLDDAFYLYKIMYRRGVVPNIITYTSLVAGLCNCGRVDEAHQLFDRMPERGIVPDGYSYNALVSAYCKQGKLQKARNFLFALVGNGFLPDTSTFIALVEAHSKCSRLAVSVNLITQLWRCGLPLSNKVFEYILYCLCEEKKPNAARNLLKKFLKNGYEPVPTVYKMLLESFCKCNCVLEALEVKESMAAAGFSLDLPIYRILIGNLCSSGHSKDGIVLMREMITSGLMPDSTICSDLIRGFCAEVSIVEAELLLSYFSENFQYSDTASFNMIIEAYSLQGKMNKSLELQDRMLKLGFVPNGLTCKLLVNGLSKSATKMLSV